MSTSAAPTFWRRHGPVAAILVLFVLLGSLYSVVDPVFEASDELNHYPFVQYLAQGHGLPVQRPGQTTLWGQEGSQPPLYYVLGAALTGWIDTGDLPDLLYLNPHANRGVPGAHDNKNMIVHTAREAFPWHGTTLAVHLIRLLSVLLGAGTVLCTYRLVLDLFPAKPYLAVAAAAVNAFIPMFLFISASVNNDNMVIFLSALALVLLVRLLVGPAPKRRRPYLAGLGIVLGLACLSKLSALGLLPLVALALLWLRVAGQTAEAQDIDGIRRGRWSRLGAWVVDCLWVFVPVAAVAGWWYVRNWRLYGDPTGLNAMLAIAGRRPAVPGLEELLGEFEGFRINFWGLFGGVNVLMRPDQVYRVLDILTLLALAGLVFGLLRALLRHQRLPWAALLLLGLWPAVEFASLVRWTISTAASQGRLMFPALPALCLFFVLGLAAWMPARLRSMGLAGVGAYLFFVALTAPFIAIQPAYPRPDLISASAIPASAQRINLRYGDAVRLLAYELDSAAVRPGGTMGVTLYWEALRRLPEDFSLSLVLLSAPQQRIAQLDTYPGGGGYPTSLWSPGQVLSDHYLLDVEPGALGPTAAWLVPGVYRLATLAPLPITDAQGQLVEFPAVARVRVEATPPTLVPSQRADANLNGAVHLLGYDLPEQGLKPGEALPLVLYWRVTGKMDSDYKVFIHLVDEGEQMAGQGDALPLGGFYPTSQWEPGEILKDRHMIDVGPELKPGSYKVWAGLYDPATGKRVAVLDQQGNPSAQEVLITTLIYP